jgi:hypothetical protein
MRLLETVSLGRVAFTARALPAIRPVSHLVDGDHVGGRGENSDEGPRDNGTPGSTQRE